jgi:hypothetical protein
MTNMMDTCCKGVPPVAVKERPVSDALSRTEEIVRALDILSNGIRGKLFCEPVGECAQNDQPWGLSRRIERINDWLENIIHELERVDNGL